MTKPVMLRTTEHGLLAEVMVWVDDDEQIEKQQLTPPRPGLVFDRQKHRWVRPEDVRVGVVPVKHKEAFKMKLDWIDSMPRVLEDLKKFNSEE